MDMKLRKTTNDGRIGVVRQRTCPIFPMELMIQAQKTDKSSCNTSRRLCKAYRRVRRVRSAVPLENVGRQEEIIDLTGQPETPLALQHENVHVGCSLNGAVFENVRAFRSLYSDSVWVSTGRQPYFH